MSVVDRGKVRDLAVTPQQSGVTTSEVTGSNSAKSHRYHVTVPCLGTGIVVSCREIHRDIAPGPYISHPGTTTTTTSQHFSGLGIPIRPPHPHHPFASSSAAAMTRATRFLTLAIPLVAVYLLMLLHVLPTPLLSQEKADAILPVVSEARSSLSSPTPLHTRLCDPSRPAPC
jgi:hypothetical protein